MDESDPRRLWATVRFEKPIWEVTADEQENIFKLLVDELRAVFDEQVKHSKRLNKSI